MRASIQCDIELDDVRVPESARLPGAEGLRGPFACLNEARYGIVWGVLGAARDTYEAALDYSQQRTQFDKPLAAFQLTQAKLVDMALEIEKGMLLALHLGRLKDAGRLEPAPDLGRQAQQRARSPSGSPARPAPSSAATASRSSTPRCGTRTT